MRFLKLHIFTLLLLFLSAHVSSVFAQPFAYPVPFNHKKDPVVNFKDLPGGGTITIYAVTGVEVAKIDIAPGTDTYPWRVVNNSGKPLAAGVYLYRISAGEFNQVKKATLLK